MGPKNIALLVLSFILVVLVPLYIFTLDSNRVPTIDSFSKLTKFSVFKAVTRELTTASPTTAASPDDVSQIYLRRTASPTTAASPDDPSQIYLRSLDRDTDTGADSGGGGVGSWIGIPKPWNLKACPDENIPQYAKDVMLKDWGDIDGESPEEAAQRCSSGIKSNLPADIPDLDGSARELEHVNIGPTSGDETYSRFFRPGFPVVFTNDATTNDNLWKEIIQVTSKIVVAGRTKGIESGYPAKVTGNMVFDCPDEACEKLLSLDTFVPLGFETHRMTPQKFAAGNEGGKVALWSSEEGGSFGLIRDDNGERELYIDSSCSVSVSTQITGEKRWVLWSPSWDVTLPDGIILPPHTRFETLLLPKETLFIPPGWWHGAEVKRGMSISATYYIEPPPCCSSGLPPDEVLNANPMGFAACDWRSKGKRWEMLPASIDGSSQSLDSGTNSGGGGRRGGDSDVKKWSVIPKPWDLTACPDDDIPFYAKDVMLKHWGGIDGESPEEAAQRCNSGIKNNLPADIPGLDGPTRKLAHVDINNVVSGDEIYSRFLRPGIPVVFTNDVIIKGNRWKEIVQTTSDIVVTGRLNGNEGGAPANSSGNMVFDCPDEACEKLLSLDTFVPLGFETHGMTPQEVTARNEGGKVALWTMLEGASFALVRDVDDDPEAHIDCSCSFSVSTQITGEKRWVLWSPSWDVTLPDGSILPPHTRFETVLLPTETLFFPPGWWHGTEVKHGMSIAATYYIVPPPCCSSGLPPDEVLNANPMGFAACDWRSKGGKWDALAEV